MTRIVYALECAIVRGWRRHARTTGPTLRAKRNDNNDNGNNDNGNERRGFSAYNPVQTIPGRQTERFFRQARFARTG